MFEFSRPRSSLLASVLLAAAVAGPLPGAIGSSIALGVFSDQGDIGSVSRPVAASYDAAYSFGGAASDRFVAIRSGSLQESTHAVNALGSSRGCSAAVSSSIGR